MDEIFTNIAGVSFSNTTSGCESRQIIIDTLYKSKQLVPGTELLLRVEPENIYDSNAIAVYAQNEHQLGYIPKEHAKHLKDKINNGSNYQCFVVAVTGGFSTFSYGINVKISEINHTILNKVETISRQPIKYTTGSVIPARLFCDRVSTPQTDNAVALPRHSHLIVTDFNQPDCDDYEYLQDLFTSAPTVDYVEYDEDGEFVVNCPEPTGNEFDDYGFSVYSSLKEYLIHTGEMSPDD